MNAKRQRAHLTTALIDNSRATSQEAQMCLNRWDTARHNTSKQSGQSGKSKDRTKTTPDFQETNHNPTYPCRNCWKILMNRLSRMSSAYLGKLRTEKKTLICRIKMISSIFKSVLFWLRILQRITPERENKLWVFAKNLIKKTQWKSNIKLV